MTNQKSGFVAVIGKPNSGKSSLINYLLGEKLALVSHKSNATRKRLNAIVMHENNQIIFVDTPGIHEKERVLNKFMLEEAYSALGDCDLILYLMSAKENIEEYEKFLEINKKNKPHFLVLTKIDLINQEKLLKKINDLNTFSDKFLELIPISIKKITYKKYLLNQIIKYLPIHPYFYDTDILTTENTKNIYKELIRESIFKNVSDEIPYSSDVIVDKIISKQHIEEIYASVIIEKNSQKGILIGQDGKTIKRIGKEARITIEAFIQNKVFLKLTVKVVPNWTKDQKMIKLLGNFL